MKALIRGKEIYPEDQWSAFTKANLEWMCGKEVDMEGNPIKGDGWTLIEDYHPEETVTE